MIRQQFTNVATNSLAIAVTSGVTNLTVNDGSVFPSTGDFSLVLWHDSGVYEVVNCTSRTGNVLIVVRGQEGTTAVDLPAGTVVVNTVTPESLTKYFADEIPFSELNLTTFSSPPSPFGLRDIDGNPLKAADFTFVNQGSATFTDNDNSATLYVPNPGATQNTLRVVTRPAPATFDLIVGCVNQLHIFNASSNFIGVGVRDTTSGELWFIAETVKVASPGTAFSNRMLVTEYTNATTFSQNFVSQNDWFGGRNIQWFRVTYDGTDITFFRSNGAFWNRIHVRQPASDSFDVDELVFLGNAGDNVTTQFDIYGTMVCWQEEVL